MSSVSCFRRLSFLLPLLGFFLATVILTYPLAFRLGTFIRDVPAVDQGSNYWNLWWAERWVSGAESQLLHTNLIFHPEGVPLAFHTLTILNGLISVPIQWLFGLAVAHNLIVLLSFPLTALATYLLAREWKAERLGAFAVGLWFAFGVYRFHHWDHLNLLSTHWLVLFLWAFSKFVHQERLCDAALAGLFWAATGLCSWYYLVFAALGAVVLGGGVGIVKGRTLRVGRWLLGALIMVGVFLLIMGRYLYLSIRISHGVPPVEVPHAVSTFFSVDVLSLLLPHALLSRFSDRAGMFAFTAECPEAIFPNAFIVLAIVGIFLMRKRLPFRLAWEWIALSVVFAILSLGPFLKVGGLVQMGEAGLILMPGFFFKMLPMMNYFKVFDRFCLMSNLGLMVFVAPFIETLVNRLAARVRFRPRSVWGLVFALSIIQGWHGGIPMTDAKPSVFFEKLAHEADDFAIVEIPFDTDDYPSHGRAMFHQTIHHKRIINGEVSRIPRDLHRRLETRPVIALLKRYQEVERYPVSDEDRERFREDAKDLGLRYVVLYPERLPTGHGDILEVFLTDTLGGTLVYSEHGMQVFQVGSV